MYRRTCIVIEERIAKETDNLVVSYARKLQYHYNSERKLVVLFARVRAQTRGNAEKSVVPCCLFVCFCCLRIIRTGHFGYLGHTLGKRR